MLMFANVSMGSLVPVALVMCVGLVLWAAGAKVLRGGLAVIGALIGGFLGLGLGEQLQLGFSPWFVALGGAIAGALLLGLAGRMAVVVALAMVFAVAAPMLVLAVDEGQQAGGGSMSIRPSSDELDATDSASAPIRDEISQWLEERDQPTAAKLVGEAAAAADKVKELAKVAGENVADELHLGQAVQEQVGEVKSLASEIMAPIRARWDATPERLRPTLLSAAAIGAVLGVLLGVLFPRFCTSIVTAAGGSLIWLAGGRTLLEGFGASWMPSSSTTWLVIWLCAALTGVVIQWTTRKPAADTPPQQA